MQSSVRYLPDCGNDWLELLLDRQIQLPPVNVSLERHLFFDLVEVVNLRRRTVRQTAPTTIRFHLVTPQDGLYYRAVRVLIGGGLYDEIYTAERTAVGEINCIKPTKAQCDYIATVLRSDLRLAG